MIVKFKPASKDTADKPSRTWKDITLWFPRIVKGEKANERLLLLPGKYQTRISDSKHRRLWRKKDGTN